MRRPRAEVNSCIDRLINGTKEADSGDVSIIALQETLEAQIAKLDTFLKDQDSEGKLVKAIQVDIKQLMGYRLDTVLRNLRSQGRLESQSAVNEEVKKQAGQLTAEVCLKHFKKLGLQVDIASKDVPELRVDGSSCQSYRTKTMRLSTPTVAEREAKGFWEKVEHFLNPEAKFYTIESSYEKITVGDNFEEYLEGQKAALRKPLEDYVDGMVSQLRKQCAEPLLQCYTTLKQELTKLMESLQKLKYS